MELTSYRCNTCIAVCIGEYCETPYQCRDCIEVLCELNYFERDADYCIGPRRCHHCVARLKFGSSVRSKLLPQNQHKCKECNKLQCYRCIEKSKSCLCMK